ncbi:MAG: aminoacyl-tRNA hydrolase [Candidatus Krumholzibacteriota bacterium]|nr:aminoacyl-tRNA hydrolase [Candidatus Krumholzibacteriota bacterium]
MRIDPLIAHDRENSVVRIDDELEIPDDEIIFRFSRSSKPGGQNVNKVNSKAVLTFDIGNSSALDEAQAALIRENLAGRINKSGILRVSSQKHRTQGSNRNAAVERFVTLIREALQIDPPRKKRKPPGFIKELRLREKKKRGVLKQTRSRPSQDDID